jgi:salicylate hydroxylase
MRPLLIAGGGIGGLAAALALSKRGFRSRILERRAEFSEAGAGIQIGPNGVRVLASLGVDHILAPHVGRPDDVCIRDGRTGRQIATLPLGAAIETRLGMPYWTAHRADLQAALLARVRADPNIVINMGFEASEVVAVTDGVKAGSSAGETVSGLALIGADGVWSRIRGYVADRADLRFTRRRAYRCVVATERAPDTLRANAVGLWLAPGGHAVHYPVRGGREIAMVVILSGATQTADWSDDVDREALLGAVKHLAPELVDLIAAGADWRSWALMEAAPLPRWSNGRIALLGDAAHPVLPYLAQGGVLALEDAVTLAAYFAQPDTTIEAAFERYAQARYRRANRVAVGARRNGAIYHLGGAAALARNLVMKSTPPTRLIGGYDWLYGWRLDEGNIRKTVA